MSALAIRTIELTRDFGPLRALDSLDLEVPAGIVFGFLGPNGSGKTTTIRLLLGLLEPTRGRAEVLGFDPTRRGAEVRARCGALLEHSGLYERLSAADNLEFYGRAWRLKPAERKARSRELLMHFGLWDRRHEAVGTWSRGMKQKLAVARALLQRPPVIFLDEPTAGLDPVAAAALYQDLSSLAKSEGTTVFLTTHNLAEAEKLCAQVGFIRQGRLLAVGSPGDLCYRNAAGSLHAEITGRGWSEEALTNLRARPEVMAIEAQRDRLQIELHGRAELAPLVAQLVHAGVSIEEVRKGRASLEEAFLTLMEEKQ